MTRRFAPPAPDEVFYARALAILAGPGRRLALVMRLVGLLYWMAVIAALAWLFAQAVDRAPPVTVHAETLLSPAIRPGDPVRVRYSFTRHRTCESDTSWLVFDGAEQVTRFGPVHAAGTGQPGQEAMVRAWPTPLSLAPGQGRLRVISSFSCPGNYLQAIYPVTVIQPDIPFAILPAGGTGPAAGPGAADATRGSVP